MRAVIEQFKRNCKRQTTLTSLANIKFYTYLLNIQAHTAVMNQKQKKEKARKERSRDYTSREDVNLVRLSVQVSG